MTECTEVNRMRPVDSPRRAYPDAPARVLAVPPRRRDGAGPGVVSLDARLAGVVFNAGRVADGTVFFLAGTIIAAGGAAWPHLPPDRLFFVAFASLLAINLLQLGRLYSTWAISSDWRPLVLAPTLLTASILATPLLSLALGGPPPAWPWLLDWIAVAGAWLVGSRAVLALMAPKLAGGARFNRRVLVVGDDERVRGVADILANRGMILTFGRLDRLHESLRETLLDDVIVALPWSDEARVSATLAVLREYPVGVHLFPDDPRPLKQGQGVSMLCGVPMLTLSSRPMGGWGRLLKATEDRLLAGLALALAAPLLAVVAVAIKLDSRGPVFFRQQRYGYNNDVFTVLKFRSMVVQPPAATVEQAKRDDPRITRVGRLLRRTSLDELPQLFNVIGGSMSLVGPRPHAVEHQTYYQHLVDEYRCRHRMKPGITGWAQINGYRGETATVELMRKRVEYDLYYIENWSLSFDLWILFLTPFACLWGKNAY